ncbi:MAG: hypothetical protein L0220_28495 [Acidobacteria bacterium]|nr:hypothetical protein [Acidobacteriota bacterium]
MAITIADAIITIKDAKGEFSSMRVHLPPATLVADADNFVTNFLGGQIDLIIGGQIVRAAIVYDLTINPAWNAVPAAGSDVEEGGLFIFETATGFTYKTRIPTFLESLVDSDSRTIPITGDVASFVSTMLSGNGTPNVSPTDNRGVDLEALISAKELFQKSRR